MLDTFGIGAAKWHTIIGGVECSSRGPSVTVPFVLSITGTATLTSTHRDMTSQQSTDARAFVFVLAMLAMFGETARPVSADDDADVTFFETKIRPALVKHCFECHSAKSPNPETDLLP